MRFQRLAVAALVSAASVASAYPGPAPMRDFEHVDAPVDKRQFGELTSLLGSLVSEGGAFITSIGGNAFTVVTDAVGDAFTLATGAGGVATSIGGKGFTILTGAAGDVGEFITSAGGKGFTVLTGAGGRAFTLVESGAGFATSFGGSAFTIATAAAGNVNTPGAAYPVMNHWAPVDGAAFFSGPFVASVFAVVAGGLVAGGFQW